MTKELLGFAAGVSLVGLAWILTWLRANKNQKINETVKKELQDIIDFCGKATWHGRVAKPLIPQGDFARDYQAFGFLWTHLESTIELLVIQQSSYSSHGHLSLYVTITEMQRDRTDEAQRPKWFCNNLAMVKYHLDHLFYDAEEPPVTE